jgi:hypothetical protein
MIDGQVSDVRTLTRKAGVKPTVTRFSGTSHPVLQEIAPGERVFGEPLVLDVPQQPQRQNAPRKRPSGDGRSTPNPHAGNRGRRGNRSRGGQTRSYTTTSSRSSGTQGR